MIAAIAALSLVAVDLEELPSAEVGARLRQSAAAAQALQGPLDGGWILFDQDHRPLMAIQLTDPPGGGKPEGAWRDDAAAGPAGSIETIEDHGGRLLLTLTPPTSDAPATLQLTRRGQGVWSGWLFDTGDRRRVTLRRGPRADSETK